MSIKSLALAAVAVLSLAGAAQAAPAGFELNTASTSTENVQPATYFYVYTQTYGNCVFRYAYVSNGYRYAYAWRRVCY